MGAKLVSMALFSRAREKFEATRKETKQIESIAIAADRIEDAREILLAHGFSERGCEVTGLDQVLSQLNLWSQE